MKVLFILNDPPYGTERSYNGLRLARTITMRGDAQVRVFLVGDAVSCAVSGQQVPNGYYNLESMLRSISRHGGEVGCCGTCLDARGIGEDHLSGSSRRSDLDELADWTLWADKVVTF